MILKAAKIGKVRASLNEGTGKAKKQPILFVVVDCLIMRLGATSEQNGPTPI